MKVKKLTSPVRTSPLNRADTLVISDACKMYKATFTDLYVGLGYKPEDISIAWHEIRTSSKGQALMKQLYANQRHITAHTFIGEEGMPGEIQERLQLEQDSMKAKPKKESAEEIQHNIEQTGETVATDIETGGLNPVADTVITVEDKKTKGGKKAKPEKVKKEPKPKKEKPEKKVKEGDRGNKTAIAKQMLIAGETDVKKIHEKSGAAIAYIRTLKYNLGKEKK